MRERLANLGQIESGMPEPTKNILGGNCRSFKTEPGDPYTLVAESRTEADAIRIFLMQKFGVSREKSRSGSGEYTSYVKLSQDQLNATTAELKIKGFRDESDPPC